MLGLGFESNLNHNPNPNPNPLGLSSQAPQSLYDVDAISPYLLSPGSLQRLPMVGDMVTRGE